MPAPERPDSPAQSGGANAGDDNADEDIGTKAAATAENSTALDLIFAALADPTRRAILGLLLEDDMAVSDVAAEFTISLAAISRHLGVLAGAGLIRQERRGRITWCQLDPESMRAAMVWMRAFGQVDPIDLDAFEQFLKAECLDLPRPGGRDARAP